MKLNRMLTLAGTAATTLAVFACAEPDSESRFDEFVEERAGFLAAPSELCDSVGRSIEGHYMLAVETGLKRGSGIMFDTTITATGDNVYRFELQPLATDKKAEPRAAVGDLIIVENVAVQAGSNEFQLALNEVAVSGEANPISGTDISATMTVTGAVCADGFLCGTGNVVIHSLGGMESSLELGATELGDGMDIATAPVLSSCIDENPASED